MNAGAVGGDKSFSYADLGIDASRPCRVARVSCNMCCSNGSVASMALGVYGPRVSQGDSTRSVVGRSRNVSVGASPRTMSASTPRATDFATPSSIDQVFVLSVAASQPGTGTVCHVMVTGEVVIQFETRSIPIVLK